MLSPDAQWSEVGGHGMRAAADYATDGAERWIAEGGRQRWAGVALGSADPHGTRVVDGVPETIRQRGPGMRRHFEASDAELAARPMPRVNVPPVTIAREPPASPSAAPEVWSVDQVVPKAARRRYANWRKQLRKCLKAAARGNASLARRLRPPDVWIPHESTPETEATATWNWDLRPLTRGERARPLPVSRHGECEPASGLSAAAVQRAGLGFADQEIVAEMLHGVEDDAECPRGTLLCAPHVSALVLWPEAEKKMAANVAKGWAMPECELPCWPLRTAPYSIVDESVRAGKPKFRMANDLSWPQPGMMSHGGEPVVSVNDSMARGKWPANPLMRCEQYAEAADIMQGGSRRRRVKLWALDCVGFYRVIGRQRAELWRNGSWTAHGVQLDERCCFGDASAATKCARVSNLVVKRTRECIDEFDARHPTVDGDWLRFLEERRAIGEAPALSWVGMYIDDEMSVSADDLLFDVDGKAVRGEFGEHLRRAAAHFEIAQKVIAELGWSSEESKEVAPAEALDGLGINVNRLDRRMRLADKKRERYAAQAAGARKLRWASASEFEQLVHRLRFAVQCYPFGKQRMHAMSRAMRAKTRTTAGLVKVSKAVAQELDWWVAELRSAEHDGVPLAAAAEAPVEEKGVVYADASGEGGFSAWTVHDGTVYMVEGEWSADEKEMLICELELLASTWGLVALAEWTSAQVVSFTDNTVAMAAMRRLGSTSPAMQAIIRRRTEWMFANGVREEARRIASEANVWADVGSRPEKGGWREVARQAHAIGLSFVRLAVPAAWRNTAALRGADPLWG